MHILSQTVFISEGKHQKHSIFSVDITLLHLEQEINLQMMSTAKQPKSKSLKNNPFGVIFHQVVLNSTVLDFYIGH